MGDGGVKEGEREQQGIGGGADGAHSAEARSGRSGRRGSDIQRQRPRSSPSFPWCPRYQPPHSLRAGFESHSSSTTALQVSASHPPIATPTKTSSPLNTPRNPNPSLHRSSSSLRRSHARPGPLGASPISRHSASSLPHPNSARLPSFVLLPHRPGKQPPPTYHLTDSSSPPPISTSQPSPLVVVGDQQDSRGRSDLPADELLDATGGAEQGATRGSRWRCRSGGGSTGSHWARCE